MLTEQQQRDIIALRQARRRRLGLGDALAAVAEPIAGAIDAVAGTRLKGCQPCRGRRARLNNLVPDLRHPLQGQNEKPPAA